LSNPFIVAMRTDPAKFLAELAPGLSLSEGKRTCRKSGARPLMNRGGRPITICTLAVHVLSAAGLVLVLVGCETVSGTGFGRGMTLIVTGLCDSRAAAMAMAEAGGISATAAEAAARTQGKAGACSFWPSPAATVMVEAVEGEYRDYRGRRTQVLRVSTPLFPERELYTLVLAGRAGTGRANE